MDNEAAGAHKTVCLGFLRPKSSWQALGWMILILPWIFGILLIFKGNPSPQETIISDIHRFN